MSLLGMCGAWSCGLVPNKLGAPGTLLTPMPKMWAVPNRLVSVAVAVSGGLRLCKEQQSSSSSSDSFSDSDGKKDQRFIEC